METLAEQLIRHEGLRLDLYRCPAGKLTIGVGHNIEDRGISKETAMSILEEDINDAIVDLRNSIPWIVRVKGPRFDVLVNMVFNLGINRFLGFKKMIRAIRESDWEEAAKEGLDSKWARQTGNRSIELMDQLRTGERQA